MLTGVDWAALSRLVPEIVLVLVFMWYTRERDKANVTAQKERDSEWREFLREERLVREAMLKDERASRNEGTVAVGGKLDNLAVLATATNALLSQHDSWARLEAARSQRQPSS